MNVPQYHPKILVNTHDESRWPMLAFLDALVARLMRDRLHIRLAICVLKTNTYSSHHIKPSTVTGALKGRNKHIMSKPSNKLVELHQLEEVLSVTGFVMSAAFHIIESVHKALRMPTVLYATEYYSPTAVSRSEKAFIS